jgi:hypothetical protein
MNKVAALKVLLAVGLVFGLAGCAPAESQAQIEADFIKIAKDSCAKAQKDDVVQVYTNDKPAKVIALSRDHAYKDYSAIYIDNKGKAQVIYELELTVCGPTYLLSMQEEANHDNSGDYEHHVKRNDDGTYTWTQHVYSEEGGKLADTTFTVLGGLIVAADEEGLPYDQTFEYGPVGGADLATLKTAVDAELERLNE